MKTRIIALSAVTAFLLTACSHGIMRGTVAMKVSDTEAHVCMGNKEVKPGDRVLVYKNQCVGKGGTKGDRGGGECKKVMLGEGAVTQNLNEHYSVVKFDAGVPFGEGTMVEKQ